MSAETKENLTWWVDSLFKVGTPILLAALFYLNSRYATREEVALNFSLNAGRITAIETALRVMAEQNKINDRQEEQLRDHEGRLRFVEHPALRSGTP